MSSISSSPRLQISYFFSKMSHYQYITEIEWLSMKGYKKTVKVKVSGIKRIKQNKIANWNQNKPRFKVFSFSLMNISLSKIIYWKQDKQKFQVKVHFIGLYCSEYRMGSEGGRGLGGGGCVWALSDIDPNGTKIQKSLNVPIHHECIRAKINISKRWKVLLRIVQNIPFNTKRHEKVTFE